MKKQSLLLLMVIVFCLTSIRLNANDIEGRFNLNVGDWFEVRFNAPLNYKVTQHGCLLNHFPKNTNSTLTIWLRYQFKKQLKNGNQILDLDIKRIQSTAFLKNHGIKLGYDSYYPKYQDNLNLKNSMIQFQVEVNPDGELIRFDSITGIFPDINLEEIGTKKTNIGVELRYNLPNKIILEAISLHIMFLPAKEGVKTIKTLSGNENWKIKTLDTSVTEFYEKYQLLVKDSIAYNYTILKKEGISVENIYIQLVDASFSIPPNTLIKGKLPEYSNKEISISLEGDSEEKYFSKKLFQIDDDGTFTCPLFMNQPYYLEIKAGNRKSWFFIEPNDTLNIRKLGVQKYVSQTDFWERPAKTGYLIESVNFDGSAAYNARLCTEMEEWMPYLPMPKSVEDYNNFRKTIEENINILYKLYDGKASEKCIDYFKAKWQYYLAADKLYFADQQPFYNELTKLEKNRTYPVDFFTEIDTISTLLFPYKWCSEYQNYNHYVFEFKQKQIRMSMGGNKNNFYRKYYFARAALKGYPMYESLYKALDEEMRNGFDAASRIEPFYLDFMKNCNDPFFTVPLEKTYNTVSTLAIGETFPIKSFMQSDSTVFNLSSFKGKPVCLILLKASLRRINDYKKEIEKFDNDEVEFIFVILPNTNVPGKIDSSILALPNVHKLDVLEQDITEKILFYKFTKIFMLDKWLRIVDDNAEDPSTRIGSDGFEKTIRKGIETKRFSKDQKASIYKTAGWSLGSILFTVLIGIWIYRIRIRRLKKQVAIQRQIKELEIKAIRSQMNPHFIFNALNSIQSLVNGKQYREANIYLAKFSVLLRGVLNNSERNMISLATELEALKLYCELEQLRFNFEFIIEVNPDVNKELIEIPGMVIQPLAENAIVHGLASIGREGLLTVHISAVDEGLKVQVEDNGIGLQNKLHDELSQKGYGLKLVRERLATLNQHENKAQLRIENKTNGKGVLTTLLISID